MAQELSGKSALVTGASRGIGAATAVALARAGVSRLMLHYNSFEEGARAVAAKAAEFGASTDLVCADLAAVSGIEACIGRIHAAGGAFDILVNNAGHLVRRARLPEFTPELFDQVMNLNVKSAWFITQAVVPHMIRAGGGVIVNVGSIAARNGGGPGSTIYAASKAAISAITKGLARELAPQGIRVNAVSPGTIDNYFHQTYSTREVLNSVVANTPAGRLGTNEDIADAILFLCSDASRYIHGQTIEINGGLYMV